MNKSCIDCKVSFEDNFENFCKLRLYVRKVLDRNQPTNTFYTSKHCRKCQGVRQALYNQTHKQRRRLHLVTPVRPRNDELSPREREALLLRIRYGYSYAIIAARMKVGECTIETYMTKAKAKLTIKIPEIELSSGSGWIGIVGYYLGQEVALKSSYKEKVISEV